MPMFATRPKFKQSLAVDIGAVTFVAREFIARIDVIEINHDLIASGFGNY